MSELAELRDETRELAAGPALTGREQQFAAYLQRLCRQAGYGVEIIACKSHENPHAGFMVLATSDRMSEADRAEQRQTLLRMTEEHLYHADRLPAGHARHDLIIRP